MDKLPRERLGNAIEAVAALEFAFEATRQYTMEREAFGSTLSKKQSIRHTMANIKTDVVACRIMVDQCQEMFMNVNTKKQFWFIAYNLIAHKL